MSACRNVRRGPPRPAAGMAWERRRRSSVSAPSPPDSHARLARGHRLVTGTILPPAMQDVGARDRRPCGGPRDVVAGPIAIRRHRRIIAAGTAASVTLPLGGKIDMPQINLKGQPLTITGKVTRITEGEFVVTGPMATGTRVRMGRTAVLDTGTMQIVVSERRSEPSDLGVFTHCGIDPRRKRYVLIKSRQHFRAGFEPIARHIVMCDGDGCPARPALFTYKSRRRSAVRGRLTRGRLRTRMTPGPVPRRACRQPPPAGRAAPGACPGPGRRPIGRRAPRGRGPADRARGGEAGGYRAARRH